MPGKRMKLTLTRRQVQAIAGWSLDCLGLPLSPDELEMYEAINFQCEKALKYDEERRMPQAKPKGDKRWSASK